MRAMLLIFLQAVVAVFVFAHPAPADEIKLIMTTITAPNTPTDRLILHKWADQINERGKGIIQIDVRDGFALANSKNFYDRLLNDVSQVSWGSLNYVSGKFRLSEVMTLPFLLDSAEQSSVVFWRLYKSGLLDSEFDQIVPLFMAAYPPSAIHLVKAPPPNFVDLSGLKIIASGETPSALITRLGGAPVSIALTDSYQALQRGTADGIYFPMTALTDFKLDEVTSYHIVSSLGGGPGGVWMAKAKYLALPREARAIIDENSGEAESRYAGMIFDQLQAQGRAKLEASNKQKVVELTPQQSAKWKADAFPLLDQWAKIDSAHQKVLAMVRELAKQVKPEH
jgi:TRAP-type C4-dicarboxylate transport system substrate-binding protein